MTLEMFLGSSVLTSPVGDGQPVTVFAASARTKRSSR